jgi:hypothetical protein
MIVMLYFNQCSGCGSIDFAYIYLESLEEEFGQGLNHLGRGLRMITAIQLRPVAELAGAIALVVIHPPWFDHAHRETERLI